MPGNALGQRAVGIFGKGQGPQGHALVQAAVAPQNTGFADNHAGAVVDEEILADGRAGVDVNARARMGHLGNDARDHRNLECIQLMGDAVVEHGVHGRIAENGFAGTGGRRIALIGGLGILFAG